MEKSTTFRTGRHCIFALHVHLVFVTKYRRKVLTEGAHETLRRLFTSICTDFEAALVESNGEDDHVHLLVEYPPKVALSKLVNSLKGVSSRRLRQVHPEEGVSQVWMACEKVAYIRRNLTQDQHL